MLVTVKIVHIVKTCKYNQQNVLIVHCFTITYDDFGLSLLLR